MEARMNGQKKVTALVGLVLALMIPNGGLARIQAANTPPQVGAQSGPQEAGFYCNAKALSPSERIHHTELTEKLLKNRKAIVETPRGYEFQFEPSSMTLAELADWAVDESKCCPFFNFHLDLEREGKLLCLGLAGPEGIKSFIRTGFQIPAK
jgi:hypothetical protein